MRENARPQKITLGEMRASGVRGLLIYCADYKCSHSIAISADQWPDDMRLSDLEDRFRHGMRQARCRHQAGFRLALEEFGTSLNRAGPIALVCD